MIQALPIDKISKRADARVIDEATVAALADSIANVGLLNPIRVRVAGDGWEVIAGAHRFAAHQHLGLADIMADVVTDDDLHAELAMIDENLCRAELSPSDRARQTARRKAIYEELHPDTQHGTPGVSRQVGDTRDRVSAERFTSDTAKATGASERTVQRDAERGQKILPEVLDMIAGTKLDTGAYMDKLKSMPGSDQFKAAQRDLLHLRHLERQQAAKPKVKIADAPLNDEAAQERQVAALMSAWNKASAEARTEFMARIDTPVFDRSEAA